MKPENSLPRSELQALLNDLCEDSLDDVSSEKLCQLLASSDQALKAYVEAIHLSTGVEEWARQEGHTVMAEEFLLEFLNQPEADSESKDSILNHEISNAGDLLPGKPSPNWTHKFAWIGALAACLSGIALISVLEMKPTEHQASKLQSDSADEHSTNISIASALDRSFVAHVVEATSDVTWTNDSAPFDYMLRVSLGERVAIETGVLRLKYFTGAEVILHGPAEFVPTGDASGHLAAGRMTGKVTNADEVEFRLSTPAAEVIDLGTVFGVAVTDSANTDVCVFDGEVEVNSLSKGTGVLEPIRLQEGMSVRLSNDGLADLDVHVDRKQFLSKLPIRPNLQLASNELSLIDAFIDGPGLSHHLVSVIDPKTGKPDEDPSRGLRHGGYSDFRLAVYSEFLDGVFIPLRTGKRVQIDSYGHVVDMPPNTGHTNGTIWARRPLPGMPFVSSMEGNGIEEVWEMGATAETFQRLANCRLGLIGLHANVGVAFDLSAMQSIEGQPIERFVCTLANLGGPVSGSAAEGGNSGRADIRFYLDGVERFTCYGVKEEDGDQLIDFTVEPFSRVLSIVVVDPGIDNEYDQIVLIDPLLELSY